MKTLNEVVDLVDMTRRVIQEYEKAGLAKTPTTTNKYGHLQYDESAIERLWQIRFYRELGYNKEQIRKALSDPSYNKHDAIVEQISRLEEKKRQLESMIEIARAYNEMDLLMGYAREDVERTKMNAKKFVRYQEGAEKYSLGLTKFQELAKEAKAVYKIDKVALVNCEIFERYLESFRIA